MKNLSRTLASFILPVGILLAAGVLISAKTKDDSDDYDFKHVRIDEAGIIIPLKAKVSKDDCTAMNKILRKYDKSLYKIDNYDGKGHFVSNGTLRDVCIDAKLRSHLTKNAQSSGLSDCTMQIGVLNGPEMCSMDHAKAKELVTKLKPILEKYTKK